MFRNVHRDEFRWRMHHSMSNHERLWWWEITHYQTGKTDVVPGSDFPLATNGEQIDDCTIEPKKVLLKWLEDDSDEKQVGLYTIKRSLLLTQACSLPNVIKIKDITSVIAVAEVKEHRGNITKEDTRIMELDGYYENQTVQVDLQDGDVTYFKNQEIVRPVTL